MLESETLHSSTEPCTLPLTNVSLSERFMCLPVPLYTPHTERSHRHTQKRCVRVTYCWVEGLNIFSSFRNPPIWALWLTNIFYILGFPTPFYSVYSIEKKKNFLIKFIWGILGGERILNVWFKFFITQIQFFAIKADKESCMALKSKQIVHSVHSSAICLLLIILTFVVFSSD